MYSLTEFSSAVIIINILATFVIALVISWVYQKTHYGISYSKSFLTALVLMAVLSSVAMMILSNNLVRALGVLGIFALIRFRTILKDTKDVAYLFFALAMGMAVGTNNYAIAIISTTTISFLLLLLAKYNFGSAIKNGFLMVVITDKDFNYNNAEGFIDKHVRSKQFLQVKTQADGEQEYYFSLIFDKNTDFGEFIKQMKAMPGVRTVELVSGNNSSEY
ncbi:MAG: DUF4956 domain-containing protein [Candidatus Yanofskybacteria bacterium]|nr:DUF4956 domain-containing protein [Candidatus Yanofskybacteria bacterium]